MSERPPFPTKPLEGESNEAFAERKRKWARETSAFIQLDPQYQGCDCPCHHGMPIYHMMPCHPDGYEAPVESF